MDGLKKKKYKKIYNEMVDVGIITATDNVYECSRNEINDGKRRKKIIIFFSFKNKSQIIYHRHQKLLRYIVEPIDHIWLELE